MTPVFKWKREQHCLPWHRSVCGEVVLTVCLGLSGRTHVVELNLEQGRMRKPVKGSEGSGGEMLAVFIIEKIAYIACTRPRFDVKHTSARNVIFLETR